MVWLESYSESTSNFWLLSETGLMALSFFPWSGNNDSVRNITSLLSGTPPQSYLSNFTLIMLSTRSQTQHQDLYGPKISECHIITTVDILGSITTFYGSRCAPPKAGNLLWKHLQRLKTRLSRERLIVLVEVYISTPLGPSCFDFQQGYLLYGDSLCQRIQNQSTRNSPTGYTLIPEVWEEHRQSTLSQSAHYPLGARMMCFPVDYLH